MLWLLLAALRALRGASTVACSQSGLGHGTVARSRDRPSREPQSQARQSESLGWAAASARRTHTAAWP